jgi:hypothetical protein
VFDVVLTDPPYDAHCQANQTSGTAMKRMVNGETKSTGIPKVDLPFPPLDDYAFAPDLVRVARRWALSFSTVEAFGEFRRACGPNYIRGCVWYKPNAMGQMTGDRPASCYEGIACLHKGKKAWNGRGSYGLWPCNGTRGKKDRHPNEKPLDLCLKLIALFSNRGETIFDPFCGSAAIGEAALRLGRKYIGLDQDPEWVVKARARLEAVTFGSTSDEQALALCTAKRADITADGWEPCEDRPRGPCMCLSATEFEPRRTDLCELHR